MSKLRVFTFHIFLFLSAVLFAASFNKATYYNAANGKKKAELKTALYGIIGNPSVKSYGSLWTYYYQTDRGSNNEVIDRYSNEVRYFGNKGSAVSGMNKEHSIPQSWWNDTSLPTYSDLHHLMPSDATANNKKSNYGMGIVTNQTWTNNSIKVGKGAAGNNGNINMWEPADNWKGDFARMYFYVVTCYEDVDFVLKEGANSMQDNTYPKLQPWAYELYLKWSKEDPVSDIERQRNETVYGIQNNRNPFIDYEGLEQYIWGTHMNVAFNPAQYENPFDGITPTPDPDPDPTPDPDPQPLGNGDYVKVTVSPTDWSGTYLIVYEDGSLALNGGLEAIDAVGNSISVNISEFTIESNDNTDAASFEIEQIEGGYSIKSRRGLYIGQISDANGLKSSDEIVYVNNISLDEECNANIVSGGTYLRYNSSSDQTRFRYFKSSTYTKQKSIALYRKTIKILLGDVNDDGNIDNADVTAMVNIILGKDDGSYNAAVADVNGDGEITIADVTALVNIILEKNK